MTVPSSSADRAVPDHVSGSALSLFCAVALKKALEEHVLPAFMRATGATVDVLFEPTGLLLQRIEAGARPGILVGTTGSLEASAVTDIFDLPSCKPVAKSGIGVAVPPEAPPPRDWLS